MTLCLFHAFAKDKLAVHVSSAAYVLHADVCAKLPCKSHKQLKVPLLQALKAVCHGNIAINHHL